MRSSAAGTEGQVGHLVVNGPKDVTYEWDAIDWRLHEDNVRRLRQRIFKAAQEKEPGHGQQSSEVDAAELEQHADQRAAGDAAQCWP
jgi:N-terminal domain of reverse transcriptase